VRGRTGDLAYVNVNVNVNVNGDLAYVMGRSGVTVQAVVGHAWSACSWSGRASGRGSRGTFPQGECVSKERGPYV
jgi:hypothetical protein